MPYVFSFHAWQEMTRRNIPLEFIEAVLDSPEQVVSGKDDRTIYQSRFDFGEGKIYLVRVIVDLTTDPLLVITVYRTSKIEKYWRA